MTEGSRVPKRKEELDEVKDQLKDIFRGFKSTLDTPACFFVPELIEFYPRVKVLLSVQDSDEAWYKSVQDTISVTTKWWYTLLTLPVISKSVNDLAKMCWVSVPGKCRGRRIILYIISG